MLRRLRELFDEYNLELFYMKMSESGFFYPAAEAVFLNEKIYDSREESFELARELGHVVERHAEFEALNASPTYKAKFEYEANKVAISILVSIFVEGELTDESQFTLEQFMSFYSIPRKLRDLCAAICSDYFILNNNVICEI